MKRTNLVLNEALLKQATRLLEAKTYSEAVNKALEESIRLAQIREITQFIGQNIWSGDIHEMRGDAPAKKQRSKKA